MVLQSDGLVLLHASFGHDGGGYTIGQSEIAGSMRSHWQLWVDCRDQRKSRKVLRRVADCIGREPFDVVIHRLEDGHRVAFVIELEARSWSDAVVETIALGQRIAYRWNISSCLGYANESLAGGARKIDLFKIAGVEAASWEIENCGD